jgi:putative ATP-dependent endonuclease of the OLD family
MVINKVEISRYDCFKENNWITFDTKVLFTMVIGRNNTGKTFFTKLLENAFVDKGQTITTPISKNEIPEIRVTITLDEQDLRKTFQSSVTSIIDYTQTYGSDLDRARHFLLGRQLEIIFSSDETFVSSKVIGEIVNDRLVTSSISTLAKNLINQIGNNLEIAKFIRINSERNITAEKEDEAAQVGADGTGSTSKIEYLLHNANGEEKLIENDLLKSLNSILGIDGGFIKISARRTNGVYEIYLLENGREDSFPLSQLGSGIKTIVQVLLTLLIHKNEENVVFCFEELENSLHPSLQRNLFDYLYTYSEEHKQKIIVTTHSSVPLNIVLGKKDTQVIHITKAENVSHAETITDFSSSKNVLDDLGIKASDILQTNGIIWVEGPSDMVYIEKWLSLFGCKYKEGVHYSYLYTGGKNLANYSASEDQDKLIKMLLVNRNAILVSDRDEADGSTPLDGFKQKIIKEMTSKGLHCWVTDGREIENYLKNETVKKLYPEYSGTKGEYDDFGLAIANVYKSFEDNKKHFAERITEKMKADDLDILKLRTRIESLNDLIETWNTPSAKNDD